MPAGARRCDHGGAVDPPTAGLTRPRCSSALSRHPVSAPALGEVVGEVLEHLGPHPDLAVLLVTPGHAGALEDLGSALRSLLAPTVLVGVVATSVSAAAEDVAAGPGLALWAGMVGPAFAVAPGAAGRPPFEPTSALVLGDASGTLPVDPAPLVAGGCSDARGLLVQDRVTTGTATVLLGPAAGLEVVAVAGVRPVGNPFTVTRAERDVVYELDGAPAYDRLLGVVADRLPAADLRLVDAGLRLVGPGGSSVAVRGVDRSNGALGVSGAVAEGSTAAFAVRDPAVASAEMDDAVAAAAPDGLLAFHLPRFAFGAPGAAGRVPAAGCCATALCAGGDGRTDAAAVVAMLGGVGRGGRAGAGGR